MDTTQKLLYRRWLRIILVALIIIVAFVLIKGRHHPEEGKQVVQPEGLVKMMGINSVPPEKLASYRHIEGVLHIQNWVTERGVRVFFVEVPTLPMVDIEVSFDAGAARNGKSGGLAYLTNQLLADGTAELNADRVAESFDNVGAQYHAESQRDVAKVDLRSLSDPTQLSPAIKTLSAILAYPAFPEAGFKREQQNALISLKQQSQMPQQIASRAFFESLYPDQPYANWVLGDEASLKALTTADLKAFHKQYYVAKNAVVTIVGNLSASEADAIAQTLTNNLPEGEKAPALPAIVDLKEAVIKRINFPSAQTHILLGEPGMKQGDPDYYPLYVGNHILGGNGSVARIFNVVRNQHGLAYSAYSYFVPMSERGPFVIGCQTRNDQADKALDLLQALIKEFVAQGPTEQELQQAKQNLLGGYALQFDSNSAICSQVAALGFYGLPLDYFNQFKSSVEKLTVDDIKMAFQKHIQPQDMVIIMVGGGEPQAKDKADVKAG